MTTTAWIIGASLVALAAAGAATAQTRPHHSGHMSFNAPQMHPERSGFHRPNRPTHHHVHGQPGYRRVHHHAL